MPPLHLTLAFRALITVLVTIVTGGVIFGILFGVGVLPGTSPPNSDSLSSSGVAVLSSSGPDLVSSSSSYFSSSSSSSANISALAHILKNSTALASSLFNATFYDSAFEEPDIQLALDRNTSTSWTPSFALSARDDVLFSVLNGTLTFTGFSIFQDPGPGELYNIDVYTLFPPVIKHYHGILVETTSGFYQRFQPLLATPGWQTFTFGSPIWFSSQIGLSIAAHNVGDVVSIVEIIFYGF